MPLSLSHGPFMRKLSVQPEESGNEMDDEQGDNGAQILDEPVLPLSFHQSLPAHKLACSVDSTDNGGALDNSNSSYLRKLSVASMTSVKSTASVSSTCSAPGGIGVTGTQSCNVLCHQGEEASFDMKPMSKRVMTSRPSFISLCSIVSETSEVPQRYLPAPLQVELDLMQRSGIEGDEPKCRSHLPILRCPSDYDINELDISVDGLRQSFFRRGNKKGLVSGIKQFPKRIRKLSTEKNRFDIYSISDETREQLKQLYVY